MRSFDLLKPSDALERLLAAINAAKRALPVETVSVADAYGRVLVADVASPMPMPEFRRSTVDGYAVRAVSTPGVLRVVGEIRMGEVSPLSLKVGEAALVHTGGNVPEGADAVLMIEQARTLDAAGGKIQTLTRLSEGENVIKAGEDVLEGEVVVRAGTRLREPEIAGLLGLGITQVEVYRKPRVALIASGDELVSPDQPTRLGQIRNTNQPMLAALVARNGGEPVIFDVLPDRRSAFERAAAKAIAENDMVVFMAGSSVGERDFVPDVVADMGAPGVLAHGILFRPGKPTLFAVADGKPVLGLPGNPISALVTGMLFAMPALHAIQRTRNPPEHGRFRAALTEDVKSPKDLEHWFPVRRVETGVAPITTKSNLIFGLVRADGLVCAPIGMDRVTAGTEVEVLGLG
jgi:molybdopterin molybdotransferase